MSRSGPKYREITIFDSQNPKHRLVFSLLWYSLVVVLFGYLTSFAFVLMLQIKALARESNTPT
jgi:sugar phosphate permease